MKIKNTADAAEYGFLPGNNGKSNASALSCALKECNNITVSKPGIYDISGTVKIPSHTRLNFLSGTVIRRVSLDDPKLEGNLFINEGAFTGQYNTDITISGAVICVNGVESAGAGSDCPNIIPGLRGHIAFLYIKNVIVEGIVITDLCKKDYAIQISDFENAVVRRVHLEGLKDGVHFGPGRNFKICDSVFRTYDDAIALNCADYSVSNPNFGEISDGVIENCIELPGYTTEAFFIRILVGTARRWKKGMRVYHSDAVLTEKGMYRVVMHPDNTAYISQNEPDFESGYKNIDGIIWIKTHKGYSVDEINMIAGCKNITVKNITLMQGRRRGVYIYTAFDEYLRSYYKGCDIPEVRNITFENINLTAKFEKFIAANIPVDNLSLKYCRSVGDSEKEFTLFAENNSQL